MSDVQTMINNDLQTTFMINFEIYSFKIYKDQLFEFFFVLQNSTKFIKMNFCFVDVFINKFKKNPDIFYIVNFLDEIAIFKMNILKH